MMMVLILFVAATRKAVPVTTQLPDNPEKVPEVVTVMVPAVATKLKLPGTFTGVPPLQVIVKL